MSQSNEPAPAPSWCYPGALRSTLYGALRDVRADTVIPPKRRARTLATYQKMLALPLSGVREIPLPLDVQSDKSVTIPLSGCTSDQQPRRVADWHAWTAALGTQGGPALVIEFRDLLVG